MADRPENKVAVITGGSRGIGFAMARTFLRDGFAVVITGRDGLRAESAAAELSKDGQVTPLVCDVTDPESVEKLFGDIRGHYDRIDVLINNAGLAHELATVDKMPVEVWKKVIDTNLTGTFLVTRAALSLMKMNAGATIVNNLSIAAQRMFPGFSAYSVSKAGALAFTNVLREELRQKGIRVLALLPGATDTEIWQQFWADAPREKMIAAETVAEAVLHAVKAPANATIEEIRIGPTAGAL